MTQALTLFFILLFEFSNIICSSAFDCHSCPLLTNIECYQCNTNCIWDEMVKSCDFEVSTGQQPYTKWNGFVEIGQTHVIKATGETRHAPKVIAEREAELLFTPTEIAPPTSAPTPSPTESIVHDWGLEHIAGSFDVTLANSSSATTWASGYPKDKGNLINDRSNTYYISNNNSDIDINFDLATNRLIQGVYMESWYVTKIAEIDIGIHPDDGYDGLEDEPAGNSYNTVPNESGGGWIWFTDIDPVPGCCNHQRIVHIPKIPARYIQIRLRGGSSTYNEKWGIRKIQISGNEDGLLPNNNGTNNIEDADYNTNSSIGYIPTDEENAKIRLAAYSHTGALLGVIDMRSPSNQRPLLEQSLTNKALAPYSTLAWSATLPWSWIREGTKILIGTTITSIGNGQTMIAHSLTLQGLAHWGSHTLTRTKVAIFGTTSDLSELDMVTHESNKLATGMFNIMPTSELRWVDEIWHVPYLVIRTSLGPKLVHSEAERRQALLDAGDDPNHEPRWEVLKQHFSHRHRNAHTGRGLSETTINCCGGNPYAAGTSIFMAWAMSKKESNGNWLWEDMGYWDGWGAAGWTGWTGMKPGTECGNTLAHELGHSQTLSHFTQGTASKWGIDDEYPLDGTNMEHHPWGYDTTTRRFRTWYRHTDTTVGKRDPMNGGESSNAETCFPQYTAYHAAKSQNWASRSPVLLTAGMGDNVDSDGAYAYSSASRQYEKITNSDIASLVGHSALLPIDVGVPVLTIIGTIGDPAEANQIYPPIRSRQGNTFHMPHPNDPNLSSIFDGAAHCVEVIYNDGFVDTGLIAVPDLTNSTELRFFSLTVPVVASNQTTPMSIELYRYDDDRYPNLSENSAKSLLYSRAITLPTVDPMEGVPEAVQLGRGWLGDSDIIVNKICSDNVNCLERASTLYWRDDEGGSLSFNAINGATVTGSSDVGTIFEVSVVRKEDGQLMKAIMVGAKFISEHGESTPLMGPSDPAINMMSDFTHGVRFWIPIELNSALADGTYHTSTPDNKILIDARRPDGSLYASFSVSIDVSTWPTESPTQAPTNWGGLEQLGTLEVELVDPNETWATGYPSSKGYLIDGDHGSTYYLHNNNTDININFDLENNRAIDGVFVKSWYVSKIPASEACIHEDDGQTTTSHEMPNINSDKWICLGFDSFTYNTEHTLYFHNAPARYVQIRLYGGSSTHNNIWGLREVSIKGNEIWIPTISPSYSPSSLPSHVPTYSPSTSPTTAYPTIAHSVTPSISPTTSLPTISPSSSPTRYPSDNPSSTPTSSPTHSVSPTHSPTQAPTTWGRLEKLGNLEVELADPNDTWANGYPKSKDNLIDSNEGSTYYLHTNNTDININFDLESNRQIDVVYVKSWYVTKIPTSEACIHADDEQPFTTHIMPESMSDKWKCQSFASFTYNTVQKLYFNGAPGRYIQIRLRGGTSTYNSKWGIREIDIKGHEDWSPTISPSSNPTVLPSSSPTSVPSGSPTTSSPTNLPTNSPSNPPSTSNPTAMPTKSPTVRPTSKNPTTSPTRTLYPTPSPTPAPTPWGGLEQLGSLEVVLADPNGNLAQGYPTRPTSNLLEPETEYYIHNTNPDININFDLDSNHLIESVYFKSWYITHIANIRACIHGDDQGPISSWENVTIPNEDSSGWQCVDYPPITGGYNHNRYADFGGVQARYVQIILRGGNSGYADRWGLRQVSIRGTV